MRSQAEENNMNQNLQLNNQFFDNSIEPLNFYKTFKEFPKYEKLVKDNSLEHLFPERPQSAIADKEEKGMNTSKDSKRFSGTDKVNDLVNCPICLDMVDNAMETPCCHNIF